MEEEDQQQQKDKRIIRPRVQVKKMLVQKGFQLIV